MHQRSIDMQTKDEKKKKITQNFIKYKQELGFSLPLKSFSKYVQFRQVVLFQT